MLLEEAFGQALLGFFVIFPLLKSVLQPHPFRLLVVPDLHAQFILLDLQLVRLFFPLSVEKKGDCGEHDAPDCVDTVGLLSKQHVLAGKGQQSNVW